MFRWWVTGGCCWPPQSTQPSSPSRTWHAPRDLCPWIRYILGLRCRNYYYVSLPDVGGRRLPRHGGCPGGGAHRGQAGPRGGLQGQQGSQRVEIQRGQNPGLAGGQGHEAGRRVLGDRGRHLGRRGLQHLQSGL